METRVWYNFRSITYTISLVVAFFKKIEMIKSSFSSLTYIYQNIMLCILNMYNFYLLIIAQ